MITAEILCVGTELLLGDIVNTNAAYLSKRLAALGVAVYRHTVVGDNPERLHAALAEASARCDIIIMSGGLGPTADDLTKETTAAFFGKKLVLDEYSLQQIKEKFSARGYNVKMTDNNIKQAYIPEGAEALKNNNGTAPGILFTSDDGKTTVIMLPGPPSELNPMFEESVVPYLASLSEGILMSKNLHIFGIGESAVEDLLRPMMVDGVNPTVAPYAGEGEVRIRVTAHGQNADECEALCNAAIEKIFAVPEIAPHIYGIDCGSIEGALVKMLQEKGLTVASAESCTGGLISKRITDISGASQVYLGSVIAYANEVKMKLLRVSEATLAAYGAVSEQTACEMAQGVRSACGTDIGISTTGIAGPGGGTPEKPVGTVYVGIATDSGCRAIRLQLSPIGGRTRIRHVSASHALYLALKEAAERK